MQSIVVLLVIELLCTLTEKHYVEVGVTMFTTSVVIKVECRNWGNHFLLQLE